MCVNEGSVCLSDLQVLVSVLVQFFDSAGLAGKLLILFYFAKSV